MVTKALTPPPPPHTEGDKMAAGGKIPPSSSSCNRPHRHDVALPPQSPIIPPTPADQQLSKFHHPADHNFWQRYKPLPPIGSTVDTTTITPPSTVLLCVRLPDGRRTNCNLSTSFPLSYLVSEVLRNSHLDQDSPATNSWSLVTSDVPKRELTNLSLTLTQAGLTKPSTLHLVQH